MLQRYPCVTCWAKSPKKGFGGLHVGGQTTQFCSLSYLILSSCNAHVRCQLWQFLSCGLGISCVTKTYQWTNTWLGWVGDFTTQIIHPQKFTMDPLKECLEEHFPFGFRPLFGAGAAKLLHRYINVDLNIYTYIKWSQHVISSYPY